MPLPPVKPTEKLPITHHVSIVPGKDDARQRAVVAVKMQGDEVRKRKVCGIFDSPADALDELNRVATRIFYFDAPEEIFGGES